MLAMADPVSQQEGPDRLRSTPDQIRLYMEKFGGLDEALAYAAKAAKLDSWHAVYLGQSTHG